MVTLLKEESERERFSVVGNRCTIRDVKIEISVARNLSSINFKTMHCLSMLYRRNG